MNNLLLLLATDKKESSSSGGGLDLSFTGGVLPDGAAFARASTGKYFNSSGVLSAAAIDEARFDYSPSTLALCGLLIEPQRSNIALYSVGTGSAWLIGGMTVTSGADTAPDGTASAIMVNVTSTANIYRQDIAVSAGATYTFSFWAKRGTATDIKYSVTNLTAGGDIVAKTSYYSSLNASTYTRVIVPFTVPAGCTSVRVFIMRDTGALGTTYVWGAQLEAGAAVSSCIPTTTTAVTRAADQLSFTIPSGVSTLRYTFDDDSTQDVSVSAGSYVVPTNLSRAWIKRIQSV